MERPEKHLDGRKDKPSRRKRGKKGIPILSKQSESRLELFGRSVRGHWSVESMHWHLDVTFREDANTTLDKQAEQNLNIIRRWSLAS